MQFEINEATVKQLAWSVKNSLGDKGHEVPSTAILEALSKGFGFESYRAIKGVATIPTPSKFLPLARELMKDDREISVYFDVNYTWTERKRGDYPIWAKLVLTEDLLVRLLELQEEVESNRSYIFDLTLDTSLVKLYWENSPEKEGRQSISVTRQGFSAKLHFGKGNDFVETRFRDFENMQQQMRERVSTEPVYVEVADKAYVLATDPDNQNRYIEAEGWGHCFAGSQESDVDFVYDRQLERIVYMRLRRSFGYERMSRSEIADVEDALKTGDENAPLENPEEWGFIETDELPDWAQKYAADDRRSL